eukprot:gnl/Hemi2/7373_TR2513_c0_g1_i1.p1 gnl/Hemi2/7373_TR2513_c0_g1~~gnl/Hemi2/7373_TR2513_c0_g1_i1.p1  ORF type:complete len:382 (+),score=118.80 gnl/Hemi2/7373_TR2513_c0_g1_i1:57-1148(+)
MQATQPPASQQTVLLPPPEEPASLATALPAVQPLRAQQPLLVCYLPQVRQFLQACLTASVKYRFVNPFVGYDTSRPVDGTAALDYTRRHGGDCYPLAVLLAQEVLDSGPLVAAAAEANDPLATTLPALAAAIPPGQLRAFAAPSFSQVRDKTPKHAVVVVEVPIKKGGVQAEVFSQVFFLLDPSLPIMEPLMLGVYERLGLGPGDTDRSDHAGSFNHASWLSEGGSERIATLHRVKSGSPSTTFFVALRPCEEAERAAFLEPPDATDKLFARGRDARGFATKLNYLKLNSTAPAASRWSYYNPELATTATVPDDVVERLAMAWNMPRASCEALLQAAERAAPPPPPAPVPKQARRKAAPAAAI